MIAVLLFKYLPSALAGVHQGSVLSQIHLLSRHSNLPESYDCVLRGWYLSDYLRTGFHGLVFRIICHNFRNGMTFGYSVPTERNREQCVLCKKSITSSVPSFWSIGKPSIGKIPWNSWAPILIKGWHEDRGYARSKTVRFRHSQALF